MEQLIGRSLNFDLTQITSSILILFAVIDVIGSIPIIIDLRRSAGHIQSRQASLVAMFIMIGFLFLGESILNVLGVDLPPFAIAGSLILFFLALEMILGVRIYRDKMSKTSSIVPLAFPLLAGAGTLTTLLSLRAIYYVENIMIAIIINILLVYVVLKSSSFLERILGESGISIFRKVFGVILLAISIKLFRSNLG